MTKPYKGEIADAKEWPLPDDLKERATEMYGPNLGYQIKGNFINHPLFRGKDGIGAITSLVVGFDEETGELETLNSRYKIVSWRNDLDWNET